MANKSTQDLTLKTNLSETDRVAFIRQVSGEWVDFALELDALSVILSKTDTYANIQTEKSNGTLVPNSWYFLSDKDVYVFANSVSSFAYTARLNAYNSDYGNNGSYSDVTIANGFTVNATGTNLGVWHSGLTPASGDMVIYNDTHYLNITGAVGTAPSGDAVNWEVVSSATNPETRGYIFENDEIGYKFDTDTTIYRKDRNGNEVWRTNIALFPWGESSMTNNFIGSGASVTNLYNHRGTWSNNHMTNGSFTSSEAVTCAYQQCLFDGDLEIDATRNAGATQYRNIGRTMTKAVTIATANVLTLNSTPVTLFTNSGSATAVVTSAEFYMSYNSATYAANTTIGIYADTATVANPQGLGTNFLAAGANSFRRFQGSTTDNILVIGDNIKVGVQTGDPTTGDSDITITAHIAIIAPELIA